LKYSKYPHKTYLNKLEFQTRQTEGKRLLILVNTLQGKEGHWSGDLGGDEKLKILRLPNAVFFPLNMIHASFKNRSEKIYLFMINQVEKNAVMVT
jgi:hypothetical protein